MGRVNYFEVDTIRQPNKYWIFKELQEKQAVIVQDVKKKDWWEGVARELGIESSKVRIEGERVIHSPTTNRYSNEGFIVRNPNMGLEELKRGAISRFMPKRIDGK